MEAVIDLGRQEEIAQVAFNALLDYGSHIMDAAGAKIWVSDDGETFREVHSESYPEIPYGAVKRIFRHEANFSPGPSGPLRETAGHALGAASRRLFRPKSASVSVYRRNLRILAVWIHADSKYARPPSEFSP